MRTIKFYIIFISCFLALNLQLSAQEKVFKKVMAAHSGITFKNAIVETEAINIFRYDYLYNGGGVGIIDVNNDGLDDIYFSGNLVPDKLYLNKGNLQFEDISKSAGINVATWSSGVAVFDVNADGWDDIYVCQSGPNLSPDRHNLLFVNNKDNTFTESSETYHLNLNGYYTQAAPLDYDLDGDLDLYIMGHPPTDNLKLPLADLLKNIENGEVASDKLMRNDNGVFKDVTLDAGILEYGFGLGLAITDVNEDRYPDIIVANDFDEGDHIFVNQRNGKFIDESVKRFKHTSNYSMGNDVGDINNDGYLDLITVDMAQINHLRSKVNMASMSPEKFSARVLLGWNYQYMHNMLQLNTGKGTYQEIAYMAGVAKTDWSWAPLFFDMNGDGWQDLFVSNGYKRDTKNNDIQKVIFDKYNENNTVGGLIDLLELIPSENIANYFFSNNKDLTFENRTTWGVDEALMSNGAAYSDLDNDGDLDLIINNVDTLASIYENTLSLNKRFLRVDFSALHMSDYLGARISFATSKTEQFREVYFVRGYQSTVTKKINFYWEEGDAPKNLVIRYNNGKYDVIQNLSPGQCITPDFSNLKVDNTNYAYQPLLKDITKHQDLEILHLENDYNDFKRESLLPHKQSAMGPTVKVGDFNNDGLDDIILGSSAGRMPQVVLQNRDGSFEATRVPSFYLHKLSEDSDIHIFDLNKDGFDDLLITSGGYEAEKDDSIYVSRLYMGNGQGFFGLVKNAFPMTFTNTQKIIAEDVDNDGDVDFLVLGGTKPGQYPKAAESYFFRNEKGFYKQDNTSFPDIDENWGLFKDAEFIDFDDDGDKDLMAVGEWTGLEIFENTGGVFHHANRDLLEKGWWNCIQANDIDRDGDLDFILGNAGANNKFHPSKNAPLSVYGNDFDDDGNYEAVLAYKNGKNLLPVRGKECSSGQMPFISEKFESYEAYARASVLDIYSKEKLATALHYEATEFRSGILRNKDGKYVFEPFPNLAQVSWIRDFEVIDLNNDGRNDILAVGNNYGAEVETTKYDANAGITLIQQEDGSFLYLNHNESGFYVHEDTREISRINLASGKVGFLVSSNNGYLRLFSFP